jgi:hypothetical protein
VRRPLALAASTSPDLQSNRTHAHAQHDPEIGFNVVD